MHLLKDMLISFLYAIIPTLGAFGFTTAITALISGGRNVTFLPPIIAAVIVFFLVYSRTMASSDYEKRNVYKELSQSISDLRSQKHELESDLTKLSTKADHTRRSAEQAVKESWQKLDNEKFALELEKKEHYEKLGLQSEQLLKNPRIITLMNSLLTIPTDQQDRILDELDTQLQLITTPPTDTH